MLNGKYLQITRIALASDGETIHNTFFYPMCDTEEKNKSDLSFYRNFRENGQKKYRVRIVSQKQREEFIGQQQYKSCAQ